jgi:hypothetical protein
MERTFQPPNPVMQVSGYEQAWQMVLGQLRSEMEKAHFETWVQPLRPLEYKDGFFTVSAFNPYTRDWVESRLASRITRLLEGMYHQSVTLRIEVGNHFYQPEEASPQQENMVPAQPIPTNVNEENQKEKAAKPAVKGRGTRKVLLERAYGSKRAAVIQPERGLFVTLYFLQQWTPLIGHSAVAVILAARSMCYWNPMTGELRNEVETEMGDLAARAATSVRTVKMVLKDDLVRQYFLRYRVRRIMTSNGVRTAGILMQVRMDDPLTPLDQEQHGQVEEEFWYSPQYGGEETEED